MTHLRPFCSPPPLAGLLVAMGLLASVACKNPSAKPSDSADTGAAGTGDGGGGGGGGAPVWDNLHLESSVTLTGGFPSGSGFYATGDDGEVYLRSDGEWTTLGVSSDEPLNGIWGTVIGEQAYAVAVGDGGTVARLDEVGWSSGQELNTANMEAIDAVNGGSLVAVGWGGAYRYEDNSWTFQAIDGSPQFNAVWTDGSTAVAVGQQGVVAISNGGEWTLETVPRQPNLTGVGGTSANDLWVVGENGVVMHNTTGEWETVDVGTSATLWGIEVLANGNAYIVGNNGFAVRHDGTTLTALPTGIDNNLYDISASSSDVIWAVGNRGATLRLQGGF